MASFNTSLLQLAYLVRLTLTGLSETSTLHPVRTAKSWLPLFPKTATVQMHSNAGHSVFFSQVRLPTFILATHLLR